MSQLYYYSAATKHGGFGELWRYRGLLKNLVAREIKVRHRQSVLGMAWAVLSPLITTTVLALIFSGFFGRGMGQARFALYVLTGLVLWNLFSAGTALGLVSIQGAGTIIRKVYVPRSIFPLAAVLSSLVNFAFSLISLAAYMAVTHARVHWITLLAIVPVLEMTVFSLGISMLLATMFVYFRDVRWFYDSALLAMFYASPIFYPPEIIADKFAHVLRFNPLWSVLASFRSCIIDCKLPLASDVVFGSISALIALVVGWVILRRFEQNLINYL